MSVVARARRASFLPARGTIAIRTRWGPQLFSSSHWQLLYPRLRRDPSRAPRDVGDARGCVCVLPALLGRLKDTAAGNGCGKSCSSGVSQQTSHRHVPCSNGDLRAFVHAPPKLVCVRFLPFLSNGRWGTGHHDQKHAGITDLRLGPVSTPTTCTRPFIRTLHQLTLLLKRLLFEIPRPCSTPTRCCV